MKNSIKLKTNQDQSPKLEKKKNEHSFWDVWDNIKHPTYI